jgi:anti-sigma B factor antagonist
MTYQPTITIRTRPAAAGTCIIEVQGEFTAFAEEELMSAYRQACDAGVHSIILNFEGLEFMSSSGIGLLVTLLIRAQRRQQRLLAHGLSDHYCQIFELTRLNEAISIYQDQSEALAAARAPAGALP